MQEIQSKHFVCHKTHFIQWAKHKLKINSLNSINKNSSGCSPFEATAKMLSSCLVAAHGVHASCSPCRLLRHPDLGNDHVAHEEGLCHAGSILQGASHHLCAAISTQSISSQQLDTVVQAWGRKEMSESHMEAQ